MLPIPSPLLEIKNLSISFQTYLGSIHAINSVSFSIKEGETVAIVGESGCGKSVTAQAIMQLIPMPPGKVEQGEILFQGKNLLSLSPAAMNEIRGRHIGMIFQDPMTSLNPTLRVGLQISEGLKLHQQISSSEARKRTIELLHDVGISEPEVRIDQYPYELSGGMRQRVMIAIAIACNPKLIIADEPTTALDVTVQAQILEMLKQLQKKRQTSIILITHDLGIVAGICDRVLVMYGGNIVESGTVEQIYQSPYHPYTQGLLRSIPRLDRDKNQELISIPGSPPSLLKAPQGCLFAPRCPYAMRICALKKPSPSLLSQDHYASCWLKAREHE